MRTILACSALLLLSAAPASADPAPDRTACDLAIRAIADGGQHRTDLLLWIARVESGRLDPADGAVRPWPWTINVAGAGHYYATKAEAMAAVTAYRAQGTQSIDVGCMQINLQQHPAAFASLEEAFDPHTNALYGAQFLDLLYRRLGDWPGAVAAYHSMTPAIGAAYLARVQATAPGASRAMLRQAVTAAAPVDPNMTAEFATRVREMAEDHRRLLADMGKGEDRPARPKWVLASAR